MSDLEQVRVLLHAASASISRSRQRVDDLNVYPVPDGDTGTNLSLTVHAVLDAVETSRPADRGALVKAVSRAALMGARGNSGVILSQIVRGAAEELGEAGDVDAARVARALRSASDAAYRAVHRPVEGTMLTVIRSLAEEAEARAAGDPAVSDLLPALVRHGEEAVARTQDQLDVLREAGVVDAGGAGLLEILRGITAGMRREELPAAPPAEAIAVEAIHQERSRYRYCTVFVLEGEELDAEALEAELEPLGDSLLVVGDPSALKVHVHTDDPGAALSAGAAQGVLEGIEIANMHRQTEQREERLLEAVPEETTCAAVAVVAGDGNRRLFESLGATSIVEGGQSMNPSVGDLAWAIENAHDHDVVLLPNNPNVLMAAEEAAGWTQVQADVIPTRSIQEGLAAMVAFDPMRSREENAAEMTGAIESVATGEVTIASRDAVLNGIAVRKGNYFGLAAGDPVAEGESFDEVARAVVERLLAEPREVLTLLRGADAPELGALVADLAERHPELEVDVQDGGQPHYPLLISAE
jgi:uncharacterized protein